MTRSVFVLAALLLACTFAVAQNNPQPIDVAPWAGVYGGTLTYKDYTTNEVVGMPLAAAVEAAGGRMEIDIRLYEWGKTFKQRYECRFDGNTLRADGTWKLEASEISNGARRMVFTRRGKDGNDHRACTFRLTFSGTADNWSVRKEVLFDGETAYFTRNLYTLQRVKAVPGDGFSAASN